MKKPSAIIDAMQRYVDGHINETKEYHKFHRWTQQQGETFDDYLILWRELAKMCKFCSDSCMQKSIRDQIIEGLCDGDTMEDPLQESELTLATTVTKCRTKEASKKNWSQMVVQEQETNMVATLHNPQPGAQQRKSHTCSDCGGTLHKGGRIHCPAYDKVCSCCHKVPEFAGADRDHTSRYHSMTALNPQPMPFTYSHLREIIYSYITLQETRLNQHPQSVSR